jgi:putative transposase
MPRRARLSVAGIPHHVLQRGNNGQDCFLAEQDYEFYLQYLKTASLRYACAIHAYVLMPNHVHLLVSPGTQDAISLLMRQLGSRYVQYVNRAHGRTGTLWEGRFRSSLLDSERYLLPSHHYIESNPVRAGIAVAPGEYAWSSYRHHAYGLEDAAIADHRIYLALGATGIERQRAYREGFRSPAEAEGEIRKSVRGGLVLGEDSFKDEIERVLARPVRPGKIGRPRKLLERLAT